ncbi:hypothetical protein AGOR_G00236670 [Albula goreensis]|uniref:Testicular haploid expressed gene protein-like n=1 Tax=Albula goreensis TaxID=1534307 RepID=A0A8T3CF04_9TELE|nr:hypothetical protein AGOR_G00236670 [Albula goreensis]
MATRIEQLAKPKPNLLKCPDRRSAYWRDRLPEKKQGETTTFELTPRWSQLCERRQREPVFPENRWRSPIWEVSMAALRASATERVCALAKHRQPKPGWQPDRPLLAKPKTAVGTVVLSSRIGQLACPKKVVTPLRLQIETRPTLASLQPRTLSSRLRLLATPKPSHPQYQLDRPVSWPVPVPAQEAVASNRVQVLAQPKPRKGLFEGYNPFSVNPAARMPTSPRGSWS